MFRFRQGENCTRFLAPPLPEQTACAGFARGKGNGRFARLQAELCFRPRTCRGRKRIAFFRAYGRELCEASCKHILGQKKGPPQTDLVQGEPDKSPRYHLNFPCGTLVASVTGGPAIPYWPFGNGAPGPPSPPPPRRLAPTGVSLCRRRAGTPSHPSLFTLTVYAKAGDLSRAVPGFAPEGTRGGPQAQYSHPHRDSDGRDSHETNIFSSQPRGGLLRRPGPGGPWGRTGYQVSWHKAMGRRGNCPAVDHSRRKAIGAPWLMFQDIAQPGAPWGAGDC